MNRHSILLFFISAFTTIASAQDVLMIAAAADLRFAMDSLIQQFESTHRVKVEVAYGSSGKLTEQIMHGAPFHMFFSADLSYPERLRAENKTASPIYSYAEGHLVLWSKRIDPRTTGMRTLLDPGVLKIAIANPLHAPYGKRALEALEYYRLAGPVRSRLVYGENISQAAQFVTSGAADIGIIALSLALAPTMKHEAGNYFLIDQKSYAPLIQGAVITQHGKDNPAASAFFRFIKTAIAASVLQHYGFTRP